MIRLFMAASGTISVGLFTMCAASANENLMLAGPAWPYTPVETAGKLFADKVSALSEGNVTITVNDSLLRGGELAPAVRDGTVELVFGIQTYLSGAEPRMGLQNLPGLIRSDDDYWKVYEAGWKEDVTGVWDEQFNAVVLAAGLMEPNLVFSTKPVQEVSDFDALRIRVSNVETAQFMAQLGASPTPLDVTDVQAGLERGIIDAFVTSLCYSYEQEMYRVTKYISDWGLAPSQAWAILVNEQVFEGLSSEARDVLRRAGEEVQQEMLEGYDEMVATCIRQFEEAGTTYFTASEDQRDQLFAEEKAQPVFDDWYRRAEEKGVDGRPIVERALKALAD